MQFWATWSFHAIDFVFNADKQDPLRVPNNIMDLIRFRGKDQLGFHIESY